MVQIKIFLGLYLVKFLNFQRNRFFREEMNISAFLNYFLLLLSLSYVLIARRLDSQ